MWALEVGCVGVGGWGWAVCVEEAYKKCCAVTTRLTLHQGGQRL